MNPRSSEQYDNRGLNVRSQLEHNTGVIIKTTDRVVEYGVVDVVCAVKHGFTWLRWTYEIELNYFTWSRSSLGFLKLAEQI